MLKHLVSDCCCSLMTLSPARIQCWSIGPQKRSLCPCPGENQHKQLSFKDLFEVALLKNPRILCAGGTPAGSLCPSVGPVCYCELVLAITALQLGQRVSPKFF